MEELGLVFIYNFINLFVSSACFPINTSEKEFVKSSIVKSDTSAMAFLKRYQYMGKSIPGALTDRREYSMAIKNFQIFNNLQVTGVLDEETKAKMNSKRCGVPDIIREEDTVSPLFDWTQEQSNRKRRYAHRGGRWSKTDITYYISIFSEKLSRRVVREEIRRGFLLWEKVTPLKFTEIYSNSADIVILFAQGYHNDVEPFDGPGRVFAHAYFPDYGGDAHFDDAESWTANSIHGVNLFQVAVHEFGHSLGLFHSNVGAAIMAPWYKDFQTDFQLHSDDIRGIQSLYGPNTEPAETTTHKPRCSEASNNIVCNDGKFDAITQLEINEVSKLFVFCGNSYMLLNESGIVSGYPKLISEGWPGLPNNLDAAISFKAVYRNFYSWNQTKKTWVVITNEIAPAKTYFFKGSQYWRADNGEMVASGYPKSIMMEWGLSGDIDSAFVWRWNEKAYFFKGNEYYRYHNNQIDGDYPKPLTLWTRKIETIDCAVHWRDETFFFLNDLYYKYDYSKMEVAENYPRKTSDFKGCGDL